MVASVPCWADGARSPTKIKGSWFVMKPATMVSGCLSRAKLRNLEKRGDTARLRAVAARHCSRLARPAGFKNELDAKFCGGLRQAG